MKENADFSVVEFLRFPKPGPDHPLKRFWSKVEKTDGCWNWTGATANGYGQFAIFGKQMIAPRFSWVIANGHIPEGLYVCHTCDNPLCVNPAHLWLGTQKENMQDMWSKGRAAARLRKKQQGASKARTDPARVGAL